MKHAIRKALIATAITAAMLAALVPTAAFAAETSTADEVNPGNYEYTITDATNVQKAIAKISTLTDEQEFLYDIDGSEGITISDATTIQKIVAKICEQPTYHEAVYETQAAETEETESIKDQYVEQSWGNIWYDSYGAAVYGYHNDYKENSTTLLTHELDGFPQSNEQLLAISGTREICKCGEDITKLIYRYDTAVANREIDPNDEKYEFEIIDGHYYYFFDSDTDTYKFLDGTDTGIESDFVRHIDECFSNYEEWHDYYQENRSESWYFVADDAPFGIYGADVMKYWYSHDMGEKVSSDFYYDYLQFNTPEMHDEKKDGDIICYSGWYITNSVVGNYVLSFNYACKCVANEQVLVKSAGWYCD